MGDLLWQLLLSLEEFSPKEGNSRFVLTVFLRKADRNTWSGKAGAQADVKRLSFSKGVKSNCATLLGQTNSKSSCHKPESILVCEHLARGRYRKTLILAKGLTLPSLAGQASGLTVQSCCRRGMHLGKVSGKPKEQLL